VLFANAAAAAEWHSRWLVASGKISGELVSDPARWLRERERFIRDAAARYPKLHARLPVVYHLDEDFVTAAKTRRSIEVVDDCDGALCGVATDELNTAWDVADLRAMFAPADASRVKRDAFVASLTGRFAGDDVAQWAADLDRAGVHDLDDDLLAVPLLATGPLSPQRGERGRGEGPPKLAIVHGATFSLVNRIESSTIATRSRDELRRLRGVGYDAIALLPFAGQRGANASEVRRFAGSPASETDLAMTLAAVRAHALGMRVMLKPQVWEHATGDPTHIEPADWKAWFASYRRFLLHEAALARIIGAEWLVIGTELTRTESRPEWHELVAAVRAIYHGRILYAANFDAFEKTPLWPLVDAIGVDAYFPLSGKRDATDGELRFGAAAVVARLDAVSRKYGKPVILTELGYPSIAAPWIEPWREQRDAAARPADQARAFAAMLGALRGSPNIAGFFIWKYESDPDRSDPTGYLPKGKPAEEIIRRAIH